MSDHDDAARIAVEAGRLLLELRADAARRGTDRRTLRDEGDRRAHELIVRLLAEHHADDAVLSEEAPDDLRRLEASRTWIVDPLDGTREFGTAGREDWAVHVALVVEHRVAAAAVSLPATGRIFTTADRRVRRGPAPSHPRVVVSRSRLPREAPAVCEAVDGQLVTMGSAGAKAMAVVSGDAEVYFHSGGLYEWDAAAPAGVAAAAGLHVSAADGSELVFNRRDPWLDGLLICAPELADEIIAVSGTATTADGPP